MSTRAAHPHPAVVRKTCECKVCVQMRAMETNLATLNPEQRSFFEAIYDDLVHASDERDYYRALVDGSWPNADEVIAGSRAKLTRRLAAVAAPTEASR